jgi:hypothetical protein
VGRRVDSGNRAATWGLMALLLIAALAAAWYFLIRPSSSSDITASRDSIVPSPANPGVVSPAESSQTAATTGTDTLADSLQSSTSGVAPDTTPTTTAAQPSTDSGSVRLSGLPRNTRVLVDELPATGTSLRLAPGRHILAISAPRFQFYTDTIDIEPGATLDLTPHLLPLNTSALRPPRAQPSAPTVVATCEQPGPGYNADRSCFDQRPRPVNPPFVALGAGIEGTPRSSVLLIHVSAEGKSLEVRPFNPSNDAAFERLARQYAETMEWLPAMKGGVAVAGWTQMAFPPAQ